MACPRGPPPSWFRDMLDENVHFAAAWGSQKEEIEYLQNQCHAYMVKINNLEREVNIGKLDADGLRNQIAEHLLSGGTNAEHLLSVPSEGTNAEQVKEAENKAKRAYDKLSRARDEVRTLNKELKELKEFKEENEKLKDENKKLKAKLENFKKATMDAIEALEDSVWDMEQDKQ